MKRMMIALGIGAALALTTPLGMSTAESKAKVKMKQCAYKSPLTGASGKWTCAPDQSCCWSVLLNKGVCGSKGLGCL